MSAQTEEIRLHPEPEHGLWMGTESHRSSVPRPRVRGLRFPVLPSGPLMAQIVGGFGALCGAYVQFGVGATLIAGGVTAAVLGALKEAGKI